MAGLRTGWPGASLSTLNPSRRQPQPSPSHRRARPGFTEPARKNPFTSNSPAGRRRRLTAMPSVSIWRMGWFMSRAARDNSRRSTVCPSSLTDAQRATRTIRQLYARTAASPTPARWLFSSQAYRLQSGSDANRVGVVMSTESEVLKKRMIRRHELRQIVPLADSTIYEMEQRGEFPRRFALTPRCVVWDLARSRLGCRASGDGSPIDHQAARRIPTCASARRDRSKSRVKREHRHRRRDEDRRRASVPRPRRPRCPTTPASCADAEVRIPPCCRRRARNGHPHARGTFRSSRC